ncbi:MAG TPA: hypothetical protein VK787_10710 [Puia sp.]|jgi:hypothetical protein|nr:hypothetical protein [Puia sp.]
MNEQATHISAWIIKEESNQAWVAIMNTSSLPIYKMILSTVNVQNKASSAKGLSIDFRSFLKLIPPGTFYTKNEIFHGMNFLSGIEIAFTDAAGKYWLRNGDGILEELEIEPYKYYDLALPLSWEYPNQKLD